MISCPNKNLDSWKRLEQARPNLAYYLWNKYNGQVPESEYGTSPNQVSFDLKSVNLLTTPKAEQLFKSLEKNKVTGDTFWRKVQELGIPKEQIDILKSFDTYDRDELITGMLANFSYTIEINTSIKQQSDFSRISERGDNPFEFQTEEIGEINKPTQYYSNLTVPGGTNYTENEIATPAITPSIKGHAAFATDKGIGWFRSDEQLINPQDYSYEDYEREGIGVDINTVSKQKGETSKTRRILELQSDLFQKGRGYDYLTRNRSFDGEQMVDDSYGFKDENNTNENKFLQLLNKDNNWVTFFTKAIIQDSAKKGYEKVLFPVGDTTAKIEGYETLEGFINGKNERVDRLIKQRVVLLNTKSTQVDIIGEKEYTKQIDSINDEIRQLEKEIKDAKAGKLQISSIANFYETTIYNILKKQGLNPKRISDEYGNGWYEIKIQPVTLSNIFLSQETNLLSSKASPATIKFVEEFFKRLGGDLEELSRKEMKEGLKSLANYNQKQIAYGIADMVNKVAWILEGKKDVALTEEVMHFAVAIVKNINPSFYQRLLNSAGKYQLTNDVISNKGYRESYQTSEGKPDIPKLKEEAIGKILAEYVIKGLEGRTEKPELIQQAQSWWQNILDWFKSLFRKTGLNIATNPFEELSSQIRKGQFEGTVEDIQDGDVMLSLGEGASQEDIYDKIKATSNVIELIDNEYVVKETGKKVGLRVSQLKELKKKGKFPSRTEAQKASDDESAAFGTKGHADIQDIANRYIDENGYVRKDATGNLSPLPQTSVSQLSADPELYRTLEQNFAERLLKITNNLVNSTRFLTETVIYDPNYANNKGIAGTVDFMAIHEDGKVDIYDWKFMENIDRKVNDIINQKKEDFNTQLTEYRRILTDVYKAPKLGKTRVVPIIINYYKQGKTKTPSAIHIAPVDASTAKYDYQLEYAIPSERTGNKELDDLIGKLQAQHAVISKTQVLDNKRFVKNEQLNLLLRNIRHIQIKQDLVPTLNYVTLLNKEAQDLIDTFDTKYKPHSPDRFTDQDLEAFVGRVLSLLKKYAPYESILKLKKLNPTDAEYVARIDKVHSLVKEYSAKDGLLNEMLTDFYDHIVGYKEGVGTLSVAEKEYKGLRSMFRTASQGGTKAIETLSLIRGRLESKIKVEQNLAFQKYQKIADKYREWADKKGYVSANMFNPLFDKVPNKEGFTNQLIDTIDKQFFTEFNEAIANRDYNWIIENTEIEKYKQKALQDREEKIKEVQSFLYDPDPIKNEEAQKSRIEAINIKYNFAEPKSSGYYQYGIAQYPTEKWYSEKYKELLAPGNEAALELYRYIKEVNEEAYSLGVLQAQDKRKFLPFRRKSALEKLVYNEGATKGLNPLQKGFESISVQEDDYEYGHRDPQTGEVIYDLRVRYTEKSLLDNPEDISTNLLENMRLFNNELIRYKNLSENHEIIKGLLQVEQTKKSIQTNLWGKPILDKETGKAFEQDNNNVNYGVLQDFYYGNYLGIATKQGGVVSKTLAEIPQKWQDNFDKVNEAMGVNLLPTDIGGRKVTTDKILETLRRFFQLKTLNFSIGIPIANTIGGYMQANINAGDYYSKTDFNIAANKISGSALSGKKDIAIIELVKLLEPFTTNFDRTKRRKITASKLGDFSVIDDLALAAFRGSELIEFNHAYAMFSNAIFIHNKVWNVNFYLKDKYEYRFDLPFSERQEIEKKMKEEKKELLKDYGIANNSKVENGKLILPSGLSLKDPSLLRYSNTTVKLVNQILGNSTRDDLNRANRDSLLRTFLLFKNWIPPLLEPRVTELKKSPGTDRWEYGRIRAFVNTFKKAGLFKLGVWKSLLVMDDQGVQIMDELLQEKLKKKSEDLGRALTKEETITKAEYIDVYQRALQGSLVDAAFAVSLMGIVWASSQLLDDDDDDPETRNYKTFAIRMLNKVRDEMLFYYWPPDMISIANGNIMPPLDLIYDIEGLIEGTNKQLYGFLSDDEEMMEKAKPLRSLLRMVPLANNLMYYTAVASPDFAEEMGITITSQARGRR